MHRLAENHELASLLFGAFCLSKAWLTALPSPTLSPAEVGGGDPVGLYHVQKQHLLIYGVPRFHVAGDGDQGLLGWCL